MIQVVRPPTSPLCEWLRHPQVQMCFSGIKLFGKIAIGYTFGLAIYSVQLARDAVAPELRQELKKAVLVGWATVVLSAIALFTIAPAGVTTTWIATYVSVFSGIVMMLAGTLVYNRVNYGFYL